MSLPRVDVQRSGRVGRGEGQRSGAATRTHLLQLRDRRPTDDEVDGAEQDKNQPEKLVLQARRRRTPLHASDEHVEDAAAPHVLDGLEVEVDVVGPLVQKRHVGLEHKHDNPEQCHPHVLEHGHEPPGHGRPVGNNLHKRREDQARAAQKRQHFERHWTVRQELADHVCAFLRHVAAHSGRVHNAGEHFLFEAHVGVGLLVVLGLVDVARLDSDPALLKVVGQLDRL